MFHHICHAIGTPQIKRHKLILKHFNLAQCFSSCSPGGDHIDLKASKKWGKQYWRKRCFCKVIGVAVWSKPGHVILLWVALKSNCLIKNGLILRVLSLLLSVCRIADIAVVWLCVRCEVIPYKCYLAAVGVLGCLS